MYTSRSLSTRAALALTTVSLLAACGDSSTASRTGELRPVSLSVATTGNTVDGAASVGGVVAIGDGRLVITKAQLVLREIELEGPGIGTACGDSSSSGNDSTSASFSRGSDDGYDDDSSGSGSSRSGSDCGEIELGPVLVDLPLTEGASQTIAVRVPQGSYHEIKFKLRQPDDDTQADMAFRAAHPEFNNVSVRVEGTYDGQAFTWTSSLRAEKKLEFYPFLVVDAGGTNITLQVNVASWFTDAYGAVNPASAGPGTAARAGIEARIGSSFGAYEDRNRDGDDDNSGPGSR
jgi:hypothetical protein